MATRNQDSTARGRRNLHANTCYIYCTAQMLLYTDTFWETCKCIRGQVRRCDSNCDCATSTQSTLSLCHLDDEFKGHPCILNVLIAFSRKYGKGTPVTHQMVQDLRNGLLRHLPGRVAVALTSYSRADYPVQPESTLGVKMTLANTAPAWSRRYTTCCRSTRWTLIGSANTGVCSL